MNMSIRGKNGKGKLKRGNPVVFTPKRTEKNNVLHMEMENDSGKIANRLKHAHKYVHRYVHPGIHTLAIHRFAKLCN